MSVYTGTRYTRSQLALLEMSIRNYYQPENGLPHPKGSLSCSLPSQAIALANKEVEKVMGRTKKRGVQKQSIDPPRCGDPSRTANHSKTRIP